MLLLCNFIPLISLGHYIDVYCSISIAFFLIDIGDCCINHGHFIVDLTNNFVLKLVNICYKRGLKTTKNLL